jgi:hypothetical protein
VTKGTTFQLTVKGTGPVIEPVTVTLSGKAIPNAAHAVTATVPLVAAAGSATTGVFFPATATGTTMQAFPDLAKLPPGKYVFDLEVKGASTQIPSNQTISDGAALAMRQGRPGPASYVGALLNTVTSRVRVEVTAPPPATGATMTSISSGAVGYFVGDPEQLAVAGTPGDLGTCDSYGLQLAAVTGGTGQSLTFKKKTFPETLSSGADFTALGNGVWQALATPSGVACTGKPDDALVQVETPSGSFVKDRPTLTMGQAAFVAQMATLTVTMPASYVAPNLACCDTELYFKNKAGSWAPYNATINRNFSDSDDSSSASFAGIITYAEFMQNPAAVEWALRVRATAPGQQFAWSNLARFTVQ